VREKYSSVAKRGSILYFVMNTLVNINNMCVGWCARNMLTCSLVCVRQESHAPLVWSFHRCARIRCEPSEGIARACSTLRYEYSLSSFLGVFLTSLQRSRKDADLRCAPSLKRCTQRSAGGQAAPTHMGACTPTWR
jgi:hypothetical protein